jgi:roadblock/LC7 domain-containing protein
MRRCAAEDGCMNANADKDYIDAKVETMHTLLDERLGAFQAMMDGRFAEMRAYIDGRFAEMRADIDGRFAEMRADIGGRFAEMRADIDGRFAEMRAYMDGRFTAMDEKIDRVVAQNTAQIIKWMIGIWIASGVLFISVMTFVVSNVSSEARASTAAVLAEVRAARAVAPAAQPPIIIQLPPVAPQQQP